MANIYNNQNVTYDGQPGDYFLENIAQYPDMKRLFRYETGIKSKRKLILFNAQNAVLKADNGCSPISASEGSNFRQKYLEVCDLKLEFAQCASELKDTVFEEELNSGALINDVSGTRFFNEFALPSLTQKGAQEYFDIASFGDPDLGEGVSAYLKTCLGIWPRLIAGVSTYSEDSTGGYDVGRSDDITTLNQTVGSRGIDYLENLYAGNTSINGKTTPLVLQMMPANQKAFYVTLNIYNNIRNTYQNSALNNGGLTQEIRDGYSALFYNGIEIIPMGRWDEVIASELSGADPYRIIYTTRDNLVINMEQEADMLNMRVWYSDDDDNTYVRAKMKVGTQYIWGSLAQVSY